MHQRNQLLFQSYLYKSFVHMYYINIISYGNNKCYT